MIYNKHAKKYNRNLKVITGRTDLNEIIKQNTRKKYLKHNTFEETHHECSINSLRVTTPAWLILVVQLAVIEDEDSNLLRVTRYKSDQTESEITFTDELITLSLVRMTQYRLCLKFQIWG